MLMLKIFIVFTLISIIPSVFIYFRLNIKEAPKALKRYFWIPPVIIVLGLCYLAFLSSAKFVNSKEVEMGWLVMLYFIITTPRLILSIVFFITLPFKPFYRGLAKPLMVISFILVLFAESILIYGVFIGRNQFEVKEYVFESPRIPKGFDGYRVAQLSDLHMGSWKGNKAALKRMVKLTNEQRADLIVFTGDLVNHRAIELEGFEEILSQLTAPDGVYSILGNHDYGSYYRFWNNKSEMTANFIDLLNRQRDMGWTLLNNEHTLLQRKNDTIALIGVENEGEPPFSQHGDLAKAMKGSEGLFQILLSHNPTHWEREVLSESTIDLMLAGHTHAMQFQLFGYSPSSIQYKQWSGGYQIGNRALYVNIGTGVIGIPFRFGAWPEITIITLKRTSQ